MSHAAAIHPPQGPGPDLPILFKQSSGAHTHTPPSPLCRTPRVLCHRENGNRRKHLKLSSAPSSHTLATALILSYLCKVNPSTYAQGAKIKGKER